MIEQLYYHLEQEYFSTPCEIVQEDIQREVPRNLIVGRRKDVLPQRRQGLERVVSPSIPFWQQLNLDSQQKCFKSASNIVYTPPVRRINGTGNRKNHKASELKKN